jgi:hypothetical protein
MGSVFRPKPPAPPPTPTPTAPEVSQSKAADAYDPRKTKARGRSSTIITSSKGIQDETITLGKKSLLGA